MLNYHGSLIVLPALGWLNRMTQFKEKAGKNRENATVGLYGYPVLMAADILAYKATLVPVGEDQKQHLELTRDIATAFNSMFDVECFPLPEPKIETTAARVMSLRDGASKMSKSAESDMTRINLTDDTDLIAQKIKRQNQMQMYCHLSLKGLKGVRGAQSCWDFCWPIRTFTRRCVKRIRRARIWCF